MSLLVVPRVVVVGDPQRVEAGLLGAPGLVDEIAWGVLLGGEEVADLHARRPTRHRTARKHPVILRGLGNPPSGYGLQNHPRTKAVDVLTLLLIIIVLLLLFGGWGYSRRGRRI
jgi:hypothetical protein